MTAPPVSPHDPASFEDEVRAMLSRRAADVSPSAAGSRAETPDLAHLPSPGGRDRALRRVLVGAAAAIVLIAGAAAYAARRDSPTAQTSASPGADAPIVWPLDDHVPAEVLASPDRAAGAYLSEAVESLDMMALQPSIVDGVTANVGYTLHGVHGEVALRLDGDRWGVTAATTDAVGLDLAYADDGDVIAQLALGPAAQSGMRLQLTAVSDDGTPADDLIARFEYVDGGEITVASPPADGAAAPGREADQVVLLPMDPSLEHSQPMLAIVLDEADTGHVAAVRLDTLVDDDGDPATPDVVIGHATRPVTGRPDLPAEDPIPPAPADTTTIPSGPEAEGNRPGAAVRPSDALFVGSGTAAEVAQAYLDDRLPERPDGLRLVPGAGSVQGTGAGEAVDVPWEIVGGSDIEGRYSGVIRLRSDVGGRWSVIAATTDQISLTVRRAEAAVGVTVARVDPDAYDSVDVDLLDADGFPVAEGEIVSWPTAGEETMVAADEGVDPSEVRSVRVRHVGGTWFSLTEVPLP